MKPNTNQPSSDFDPPGIQESKVADRSTAPDSESVPVKELDDCWNRIGVRGNGTCPELAKYVHCRNCPVYSSVGTHLLNRRIPPDYRQEWTRHVSRTSRMESRASPALALCETSFDPAERDSRRLSLLIFRLGVEWLALPTHALQEVAAFVTNRSRKSLDETEPIIDSQASTITQRCVIHSLPHRRRSVVLGLVNVRGELVICVSLGRLLGETQPLGTDAPRYRSPLTRLLVAEWDGNRLVFPVDEAHGVHRLHPGDLKDPPATFAAKKWQPHVDEPPADSDAALETLRTDEESPRGISYLRGTFTWNERTVGLLNADLLFAALHRNLT